MSKAQGQFTIIDYNDAITLTGFIESNRAKTQRYNPDSGGYTPDWSTDNMVLTATLFKAGSGDDILDSADKRGYVQSVRWYADGVEITNQTGYSISAVATDKGRTLTISENKLSPNVPGLEISCTIVYRDPTTGLDLTFTEGMSLSLVINGGGLVDLVCTTPNGNIFKNGGVASLQAKAELWRGSVIDTTKVSYQWYKMDPSQTTDAGGGVGWKKLANASGKYAGVTTATLTIYASQVDSFAVFECVAKDTDNTSPTYNLSFKDTVSFVDMSDNLTVIISSTGGDIFKNGEGGTTLTAHVYQGGDEIDDTPPYQGSYTWTKYRDATPNDGIDDPVTIDTDWGTNGQKTGKVLAVGSAEVDVKATFICEVEI